MSKKLTYEYIKSEFEKENYVLLSDEYKNNYTKLEYICPSGHRHKISWAKWTQTKRCPYCAGNIKLNIDFIRKKFEEENYVLLTENYTDNKQKLNYICPDGHKYLVSWVSWYKGQRCLFCAGRSVLNIEFIKEEFKKEGYILLSKGYINNTQKLKYICSKGHKHFITWRDWQQGCRCGLCANINKSIKISGSGHPQWKGGISCEPYCDAWADKEYKESIKERDGNKCLNLDCFGNIQRLSVHHIDYNKKNCEPRNLITLCASCNSRANKNREWHKAWYKTLINKRYNYKEVV